ncbi:hypothetical protein HZA56_10405 [Candidatus Poribacteria bacterium]|nr:hypothetical protein [Candidatus Poribacteria bacterium]
MKIAVLLLILCFLFAQGCSTSMEQVNKDAKSGGETVGSVMRVPHSAAEGVAEGIAGKPESNPYNR